MNKKELLKDAVRSVKENNNVYNIFKLIQSSAKVLRAGNGLIWKEVIEIVEEVYNQKINFGE